MVKSQSAGIKRTASFLFIVSAMVLFSTALTAQDVVIRGGWYFNTDEENFARNRTMIIVSGKFFAINEDVPGLDLSGFEQIQLQNDDYILPGIFDIHAHFNMTFGQSRRDEWEVYPILLLANGVTSSWPAGEYNPEEMMAARRRIERGEQIGTRILNSGQYFGQGWDRNAPVEDIIKEVDRMHAEGVVGFKAKGINATHLKALIDRVHYHGKTVSAHLGSGSRTSVNAKDAIMMGLDRVEHFLGGDAFPPTRSAYASLENMTPDTPGIKEIIDLYIKHGVYFDATMSCYGYYGDKSYPGYDYWVDERNFFTPYARELMKDKGRGGNEQFQKIYYAKRGTFKAFYDAGGEDLMTLGTDNVCTGDYITGFSWHREIEAFTFAGIPPAKALKMATINGARALNLSDMFGSIDVGKIADLLVIKGNPIQNIRNTRTVHTVLKAGIKYDTADLFKSVEGKLGPTGPDDMVNW
ncbi:amidohydrolase family protein [candidate division KSB1 bacterium]